MRSGEVRVLIGSTQKMGAGTNAQRKLIALHHVDCPWRPSDLQQREGRIIRQGNENPKVDIYTYVTENTFDSYLYQLVEGKQKFIGQIMTSKSPVRSAEDIDETALSYAEIKALCSGNPHIKEKMDLDIEVQKLKLLRSNHMSQRYALEDQLIRKFPKEIASMHQWIDGLESDMALLKDKTQPNADGFCPMVIGGQTYTEKKAAGTAILEACNVLTSADPVPLGSYRGFKLTLCFAGHWLCPAGVILRDRCYENLWLLDGSQTPGTRIAAVRAVCPGQRRDLLRHGFDAGTAGHCTGGDFHHYAGNGLWTAPVRCAAI